jgi:hypothetical protein
MTSYHPTTQLAREMGIIASPGTPSLSDKARVALNRVLRDLDEEERESLVIMGAVGAWDWHMVDGTDRIWHFRENGTTSWNMLNDRNERVVLEDANRLRGAFV